METGADIQVEKGNWAKVHNTILQKLAFIKLDGREAKCLFFLFSMTYGKREKEHAISLSLWASGTDLDKRNVAKVIDGLIGRNIIYRIGSGRGRGSITVYGFNKHFEKWDNATEKVSYITPIEKVSPITPLIPEKVSYITPEKVSPITPTIDKKRTTTTTTESGGSGSFESLADPQADVLRCWRENMEVPLTPIIVTDLKACIAGYGAANVMEAIAIAVGAETRTLRYVKGVLNRRGSAVNGTGEHTRKVLVDDD